MTPLEMRAAPLDEGDLDMLEIEIQQTPTDDLLAERKRLRATIQGSYVGVREPGSGTHPVVATLQIVEAEINRRGGYWADAVAERVIGRADVPIDGPQTFDLIKRDPVSAPTTEYVEQPALTEMDIDDFVRQLAKSTNAELQELGHHLSNMVDTMAGFLRRSVGVHPDPEKLELVEEAKLEREMRDWTGKTLLRGALIGAAAGTGLGYLAFRSMKVAAVTGALASAVAAKYSWWWRKVIGAAAPPDPKAQSTEEKTALDAGAATLGDWYDEPFKLGIMGDPHHIGEPRLDPDLYWRR
jgi:hypothetical protein